mmetsp:Transcript_16074/g.33254  ORF Transcript_16074/g.33254 Transcript_16074/m.33254 type:complete len:224 (-) Transcript_16074:1599-2270(-)
MRMPRVHGPWLLLWIGLLWVMHMRRWGMLLIALMMLMMMPCCWWIVTLRMIMIGLLLLWIGSISSLMFWVAIVAHGRSFGAIFLGRGLRRGPSTLLRRRGLVGVGDSRRRTSWNKGWSRSSQRRSSESGGRRTLVNTRTPRGWRIGSRMVEMRRLVMMSMVLLVRRGVVVVGRNRDLWHGRPYSASLKIRIRGFFGSVPVHRLAVCIRESTGCRGRNVSRIFR